MVATTTMKIAVAMKPMRIIGLMPISPAAKAVAGGRAATRARGVEVLMPARPRPALELELSLLDDHDGVGQATRLQAELEPGRNAEDAPGEALREGIAKERVAGTLVRGHPSVAARALRGGRMKKLYLALFVPGTMTDMENFEDYSEYMKALAEKPREHALLQMKVGGLRALSQVGG